jgi:hypothetical protein
VTEENHMSHDDYAQGYAQGYKDGSPDTLSVRVIGWSIAIVLICLPIGMLYLLFWLGRHFETFRTLTELLGQYSQFADLDMSKRVPELAKVLIGFAVAFVFIVFWMYSPWILAGTLFRSSLKDKSDEYRRGYYDGKTAARKAGRP